MERKKKSEKRIIKRIVVGPLETNCYLVGDSETKETVIIDPGAEPEKIFSAIKENGLKPKFILLTHSHFDHIGALNAVAREFGIENKKIKDGDELGIGNLKIKVLATSGHTPDSVCYVVGRSIFSGDTLFKQGIGRTDLKDGDFNQIQKSLKQLMEFPDAFRVWPGHGEPTTIAEERRKNPFL